MTLKFVVITIILLLLVIIFRWQWIIRLIRLWYLSLKYGKYSHEFCIFFKENNLISPYIACLKDQITSHFVVFSKSAKKSPEFHTETTIDYEGIPFMVSSKNLIQRKGVPDCINVATLSDIKFMVIGYNEFIHGMKMKSMYFFLNDRFVMGEFLFSDLKRAKPEDLIATLSSKYLKGTPIGKEFFYINDSEGNRLNFENNGFSISIKYLFGKDPSTNMILAESYQAGVNLSEKNLKHLRNEELLDRL